MLFGIIFLLLALLCAFATGSVAESINDDNRKRAIVGGVVFMLVFALFAVNRFSGVDRGTPSELTSLKTDTVYELRGQMPTGNGKTLANLATLGGDWLVYVLNGPVEGNPKYVKTSKKDGKIVLEPFLLSSEKG